MILIIGGVVFQWKYLPNLLYRSKDKDIAKLFRFEFGIGEDSDPAKIKHTLMLADTVA